MAFKRLIYPFIAFSLLGAFCLQRRNSVEPHLCTWEVPQSNHRGALALPS